MKFFFLKFFILLISFSCYSQDKEQDPKDNIYYKLYNSADSLKIPGKIGKINPATYRIADSLDALHPTAYYEKAADYLGKSKFNDAAFLYFVGNSRYKYFNSVNPDYQASGDGALKTALGAMLGEPIGMYLKTNIDNFISILKSSAEYYSVNNFKYYSKEKDVEKFELVSNNLLKQISDLQKNRKKYEKEWRKETEEMKELFFK